jgi:multicomponent Na+:H+ antiporter subunit G
MGYVFIFLGILLLLISALGVIRLPDTLTRMHAGAKASSLGALLVLVGLAILEPSLSFKLFLLALFILFTTPLASSIIAKTLYKQKRFYHKKDES